MCLQQGGVSSAVTDSYQTQMLMYGVGMRLPNGCREGKIV